MESKAIDRAIRASGGLASIAKSFGISPQAVHKWRRKGVPAERVLVLEEMSGISRSEIRPDLYPRELSTTKRKAG